MSNPVTVGDASRAVVLICNLLKKFTLQEQLAIIEGLAVALQNAINDEKNG